MSVDPTLADFLAGCPPLGALGDAGLARAAGQAVVERRTAGEVVLDAFRADVDELVAVREGSVQLWSDPFRDTPDQIVGPRGLFGFSAILSGRAIGPLAVALTDVVLVRLPRATVAAAFATPEGARFLVESATRPDGAGGWALTEAPLGSLVDRPPLVVDPASPVDEVARRMVAAGEAAAVVPLGDGFGLLTDAGLRRSIVTGELAPGAPAQVVARWVGPPLTMAASATTSDALSAVVEHGHDAVLVLADGRPHGVLTAVDFLASASLPGISLHQRISRAVEPSTLVEVGRELPALLSDLMGRGFSPGRAIDLHGSVLDALVRRTLHLVLARHPHLTPDAFAWLALGSTGRREAVPSSDLDAAVVFADWVSPPQQERYRAAFAEVSRILAQAGLGTDDHGATPASVHFARTDSDWRRAAGAWLADPVKDQGAIMTSLLADSRPIFGDPALPACTRVLRTVRKHSGTLRLLLDETLTHRARQRSGWAGLRRAATFDVKLYALLPIVNLARWVSLAAGSDAVGTVERLRGVTGSEVLPEGQARVLAEVFEVLQGMRLRFQMDQIAAGTTPSDRLVIDRLSPIDRSVLTRAVREIQAAQRRAENIARVVPPEEWAGGRR